MKKLLIVICLLIALINPIAVKAEEQLDTINELITEESTYIAEDNEPKEVIITEDKTEEIKTDTIPMRPLNLRYNNVTTDKISIVWDDNLGYDQVTSYNIYVNSNKVGSSNLSSYVIEDLLPGRTYEITVTAVNFYGESLESDPITVTTKDKEGIVPTDLKIANITDNSAYITWNGEGIYNIYLNGELLDTVFKTNYQLDNLESETEYEFTVESYMDPTKHESIKFSTVNTITQENVSDIIKAGFDYILFMWPYIAVIAGLIITFAIVSMILGAFGYFWIG